ncbi:MAG: hypothetical protein QM736_13865 [Vicinamibacterales bacterium]
MTPLVLFLLAGAAVYLGTIDAAFSALMRLSLRLLAERSARPGSLVEYLDDPVLLFAPVRLLIAVINAVATVLLARGVGVYGSAVGAAVIVSVAVFIALFQVGAAAAARPRIGACARGAAAHVPSDCPRAPSDCELDGARGADAQTGGAASEEARIPATKSRAAYLDTAKRKASSRARAHCFRVLSTSATRWFAKSMTPQLTSWPLRTTRRWGYCLSRVPRAGVFAVPGLR